MVEKINDVLLDNFYPQQAIHSIFKFESLTEIDEDAHKDCL